MSKCSFKFCKSVKPKRLGKDGISFFNIPYEPLRREKWLEVLRRQRNDPFFNPRTKIVICSKHFNENDSYVTFCGRKRLVGEAVPREDTTSDISTVEADRKKLTSCEGPSRPGTSKTSCDYSSDTSDFNENCDEIGKDTAHLDVRCEEEDNTQLTSFENPFLPGTRYPGLNNTSDRSDTDENCDDSEQNIKVDTAYLDMSCVEIKKEIENVSSTQSTRCEDPLQPGTSKSSNTDEIAKTMKIEVEESSPNITEEYIDNRLDDLMSSRDKCFEKFGEYVVTMLKRIPLQQALELQPQIVDLITSTVNKCMNNKDGPMTLQIKTEDEPSVKEN